MALRYGVSSTRQLWWSGEGWSPSGLSVLLPVEMSQPWAQLPSTEAPGLLHLLYSQAGKWRSCCSLFKAESRFQVLMICFWLVKDYWLQIFVKPGCFYFHPISAQILEFLLFNWEPVIMYSPGWFLCSLGGQNVAWNHSLSACVPVPRKHGHMGSL